MSSPNPNEDPSPPPPAASAAAASTKTPLDDATIAQALQCYQQLTETYSFPPSVVSLAMETIGPNVQECCTYIINEGLAEDEGGPVIPKENCPHVDAHVCIPVQDLPPPSEWEECTHLGQEGQNTGGRKSDLEGSSCPPGQNWICLECKVVRCSRYVNGHGQSHWEATKQEKDSSGRDGAGHCIAMSMQDLSIWCYECQAYLHQDSLLPYLKKMEQLKFGGGGKEQDGDTGEEDGGGVNEKEGNNGPEEEEEKDDSTNANGESTNNNNGGAQYHSRNGTEGSESNRGIKRNRSEEEEEEFNHEEGEEEDNKQQEDVDPMEEHDFGENDSVDDGIYHFHSHQRPYCPHPDRPTSIKELANFIRSDKCRSIIALTGAGMSRSSGIPDFRSAGGLYDSLDPSRLTATPQEREMMSIDPTFVLDKHLFMQNSLPCLETKRPFILGTDDQKWKATLAHRFLELLAHKTQKVTRIYTQNIDGLEGQCQRLPKEKVIPVHGSMDRVACEACGAEMNFKEFCHQVKTKIKDITQKDLSAPAESSVIRCKACHQATVKPTIVLFHSRLPEEFFNSLQEDIPDVDLLLVLGTSLSVAPANQIVALVPETAIRVVMNKEPVGYCLGIDYSDTPERDFFCQGGCDEVALRLVEELGWMEDLKAMVEDLPPSSRELIANL